MSLVGAMRPEAMRPRENAQPAYVADDVGKGEGLPTSVPNAVPPTVEAETVEEDHREDVPPDDGRLEGPSFVSLQVGLAHGRVTGSIVDQRLADALLSVVVHSVVVVGDDESGW